MKIHWDKAILVPVHKSGRVRKVYKEQQLGWCVLIQCSRYLKHRYIHLPGMPLVKKGEIIWKERGMLCEREEEG